MKFLHTADWQIGMKAAHVGAVGDRVRQERIEAARRVVRTANQRQADFLLLAGDTFEDNAVDRVLVQKVADLLGEFNGPVYVIPGNHDPWGPGSVWRHAAWTSQTRVTVLTRPQPVEIPAGRLYPCPVLEKHSLRDPTAWIDARECETIAVAVAHGTVEGVAADEPDYPIARDAAGRSGLDYLALGHWHSTATYEDEAAVVRTAYCGTHETTRFGERDSGNALWVEIPRRGSPPQVERIHLGGLKWETVEKEIRGEVDLTEVCRGIETLADPANTLLDLRLSGVLRASEVAQLRRIEELVAARCLYGRIDRSGLLPEPQDDGWLSDLPPGPLQETARQLGRLSDPTFAEGRPEGASAEVAAEALRQMYVMLS